MKVTNKEVCLIKERSTKEKIMIITTLKDMIYYNFKIHPFFFSDVAKWRLFNLDL